MENEKNKAAYERIYGTKSQRAQLTSRRPGFCLMCAQPISVCQSTGGETQPETKHNAQGAKEEHVHE